MKRRLSVHTLRLCTAAELTADEARAMALVEIEAAEAERKTGPLFRHFADEFMRRQGPRWKPTTRESNRSALQNHILPFFGDRRPSGAAGISPPGTAWCRASTRRAASRARARYRRWASAT